MAEDIERLTAEFEAFAPTGEADRDIERLKSLVEQWQKQSSGIRRTALGSMFGVFERNPDTTELGTPGPVVHAIESEVGYESDLFASVSRVPSFYTLWMVNRLLNSKIEKEHRLRWLTLLRKVAENPIATPSLRESASHFLKRQAR